MLPALSLAPTPSTPPCCCSFSLHSFSNITTLAPVINWDRMTSHTTLRGMSWLETSEANSQVLIWHLCYLKLNTCNLFIFPRQNSHIQCCFLLVLLAETQIKNLKGHFNYLHFLTLYFYPLVKKKKRPLSLSSWNKAASIKARSLSQAPLFVVWTLQLITSGSQVSVNSVFNSSTYSLCHL